MAEESGSEMKNAFQRAMERVANLETPSSEKRLEWKGLPEGKGLAAKFMKGDVDLGGMKGFEKELEPYVMRGVVDVLAANVQVPRTAPLETAANRALDGLRTVFVGQQKAEDVIGRVQYVCDQYKSYGAQQRQQMFDDLVRRYTMQVQTSLRQQGLTQSTAVNVETLPEFQQEWQRLRVQMDQQYEEHLEGFRREFRSIAAEG